MTDGICIADGCRKPVTVLKWLLCRPHYLVFHKRGGVLPRRPATDEDWRPVPGYEGYYDASSWGRIWSIRACWMLIQAESANGYLVVTLSVNRQRSQPGVHQIIALTFIGSCPPGMEVLHGDNIKIHNIPENLRYGTQAENIQQSVRDGNHRGLRANRV